jgi:nitrogenase-stabilizing/protective protein
MSDTIENWQARFAELESAEEYCDFFGIDLDRSLLARNRLAILQRFHDLLPAQWGALAYEELRTTFLLAYSSMIDSSAREAQLFKIFKPQIVGIPLSAIGGRRKEATCH